MNLFNNHAVTDITNKLLKELEPAFTKNLKGRIDSEINRHINWLFFDEHHESFTHHHSFYNDLPKSDLGLCRKMLNEKLTEVILGDRIQKAINEKVDAMFNEKLDAAIEEAIQKKAAKIAFTKANA